MRKFGIITNNRAYFYFYQAKLEDGSFGIVLTHNPEAERGIIDTGFTGNILFPNKYKAIGQNIKETNPLKLSNKQDLPCTQATTQIAFFQEKLQEESILFADISQPIIGMDFLNSFEEVTFDFDNQEIYY